MISCILYCREIIVESSWNVSETPPDHIQEVLQNAKPWVGMMPILSYNVAPAVTIIARSSAISDVGIEMVPNFQ